MIVPTTAELLERIKPGDLARKCKISRVAAHRIRKGGTIPVTVLPDLAELLDLDVASLSLVIEIDQRRRTLQLTA